MSKSCEPRQELHVSPVAKLSLRLLPAIILDNDEDDDGNFTNWMSSYWGHGGDGGGGHSKERKHSFRGNASRHKADRRASLPCPSQLDAMHLNRIHAAAMAPAPAHMKGREDKEFRSHPRARRVSSDENSRKSNIPEQHPITPIPELAESFERRLRFRNQKVMSLILWLQGDADNVCLLCHEEKRNGQVQELHCSHRFHKEPGRKPEQVRPRSGSSAATCERRKCGDENRKSGEAAISTEQEDYHHVPRRQLSLRRQR
ncbi:leukemia NUP98 fusion partner 1 [Alosa sapidissima]|uniref:leukemia NUP98 fusion partner 1 n=1 Tax=Alosa sapidissima TaxID=34773 RepID=UPI001C09E669|nr:leukemia NUP98 fusion partner 1 [Alosa sapidissima]